MTSGGQPLKRQMVFDHFASLIDSGQLQPGDRLPVYGEIQEQFRISHVTAMRVIGALKEAHYVRTSTQGIFVYLGGPDRLYQLLCDALNTLQDAGQQLEIQEFASLPCIAGQDGGACWNPDTGRWEAPRNNGK